MNVSLVGQAHHQHLSVWGHKAVTTERPTGARYLGQLGMRSGCALTPSATGHMASHLASATNRTGTTVNAGEGRRDTLTHLVHVP